MSARWTPHDIARLRSLYKGDSYTDEDAAALLGRTPRSIAIKRQKLGIVSRRHKRAEDRSSQSLAEVLRRRGFTVTEPSHSGVVSL